MPIGPCRSSAFGNIYSGGFVLRGRIFTGLGIIGAITTIIAMSTVPSTYDATPFFAVIGVLLSIIIAALGEMIVVLEKKSNENNDEGNK